MLTFGKAAAACNCFVGTAAIDEHGNCHCVDGPTGGGDGRMYTQGPLRPTVNYYLNPAPAPAPAPAANAPAGKSVEPAADNTIFGFNPLLVLGAVGAALYFFSTSEKEGKTK